MKLLDRYILKGFVFSFLVVFVSMVALTIMVDMVVNIEEFLKVEGDAGPQSAWAVFGHIIRYYFFRTFEYFQWLCGAAMLVGAAFAIARLNKSNELVALKASGVSVYRIIWPIIAASLVVSLLYIVDQELIIPNSIDQLVARRSAAESSDAFEVEYVRDGNNALIYAPRYVPQTQTMEARATYAPDGKTPVARHPVSITERSAETDENEFFIEADRAVYNEARRGWDLAGGRRWKAIPPGESAGEDVFGKEEPVDFFPTDVDPTTLMRQRRRDFYRYLSFRRLATLLRESALVNPDLYETVMHQHLSKPILNLIVLLLGLPFVIGREGKSYFISIVVCVALFVLVLGIEYVSAEFGSQGYVPPILGAYLPVLIFLPAAVLCLDTMRT